MKSSLYKNVTAIVGILGIIGGVVLGNVIKSIDFNTFETGFNFALMISCWIGTALLCLIFYGIACILEYLENMGKESSIEETPAPVDVQPTSEPAEKGDWICPKCGKINKKYVGSCGCGYSKNNADLWECPKCHIFTPYTDDNECLNCHWKV